MRLAGLEVENFRSIDRIFIQNFGEFNVFIGKNNSGKSNVLSSIDRLIGFMRRAEIATFSTTLTHSIDFHKKSSLGVIRVAGLLEIGGEEVQSIVEALANEYPQVKNTLPTTFGGLNILVEMKGEAQAAASPTASPYVQYISKIALVERRDCFDGFDQLDETVLLEVSSEAARGIAEKAAEESELEAANRGLEKMSADWDGIFESTDRDLAELRSSRVFQQNLSRYLLRSDIPEEVASKVTSFTRDTKNLADFRTKFEAYRLTVRETLDNRRGQNLPHPIIAYPGASDTVPAYIGYTLELLAAGNLLHLADRREPIGAGEADKLLELKMTRGMDSTLKTIQGTVQTLLGVKIDAFAGKPSNSPRRGMALSRPRREAELDVDDFLVEVNGSGVREALRVILDVEFEKPHILLVEEPEVHLHPAFEIAMLQHLQAVSQHTQVFLTTHSTNFVDSGELGNIYIVRNDDSTSVQHVNISTAEDELPKELGIRLSSIFMFDRLVFVEGQTDEAILRSFANKLSINLSEANVGFVIMGGSRNFAHYAASATLSLLTKRQVCSHFVIDRDEQVEDGIQKLTNQLGSLGDLHVLRKREIENYLLDPPALAAYITQRSEKQVTSEEISAALNDIAEDLKDLAVAKRVATQSCNLHRADRAEILRNWESMGIAPAAEQALVNLSQAISEKVENLPTIVAEAENHLNDRWNEKKLDLVPGEEILVDLFRKYGLRYKKDRDGVGIVHHLDRGRIDGEIATLLKAIKSATPRA